MYLALYFVGSLIPTFLLSRVILWITKSWEADIRRTLLCHAGSLLICALIGGIRMADGGAFAGVEAGLSYVPAQITWLLVDLSLRYRRSRRAA